MSLYRFLFETLSSMLKKDLAYTKKQEAKFKKQYEDAATEATRLRKQLDRIYSRLPVRIYHKLTGKKPKR